MPHLQHICSVELFEKAAHRCKHVDANVDVCEAAVAAAWSIRVDVRCHLDACAPSRVIAIRYAHAHVLHVSVPVLLCRVNGWKGAAVQIVSPKRHLSNDILLFSA
eukprot:CAMPEP_0178458700 /NCGR_PEP_ID=MMETSP0689_2-20121128/47684_1 /TAXON_ID=160604 /ORGANISM="Amphidinium massartii, Strain CS-259" /LENGTH=104 /DNA_ID=CAMNT_0020085023 /DNA_START=100 /DNA_END=410 /DNA_ORIENTATION=+